MRVKHTRYSVPGWGVGDLWTSDGVVLAHEFAFHDAARHDPGSGPALRAAAGAAPGAASHEGAASPPTGTVPAHPSHVGHAFVPGAGLSGAGVPRSTGPARAAPPTSRPVTVEQLVERFALFLSGAAVDFSDVELEVDDLTPFQLAVARALRAIPRGEVASYAELAALAGYPGAQRAVGTFCARNRFSFLLPCHRVVGSNGIGGYGEVGVAVKRRLLRLEGVVL